MRRLLKAHEHDRRRFSAVFERYGKKTNFHGYSEETLLLRKVIDIETNEIVADHLWFNDGKAFQQARLSPGVKIQFDARVKQYKKGYVNRAAGINQQKFDYKLSHPTKVSIVSSEM
jgi:hypothetical protein